MLLELVEPLHRQAEVHPISRHGRDIVGQVFELAQRRQFIDEEQATLRHRALPVLESLHARRNQKPEPCPLGLRPLWGDDGVRVVDRFTNSSIEKDDF